jgi:hypothetical protein
MAPNTGFQAQTLEIVRYLFNSMSYRIRIRLAVESQPLGRGEDRQPFDAACPPLSVVSQSVSSGAWRVNTFPIKTVFGNIVHRAPRLHLHNQREASRPPIIILGKVS